MDWKVKKLAQYIQEAKRITCLTGAGISTESGLPDFRGSKGLWKEDIEREKIISIDYFKHNPEQFWRYFKEIFHLKIVGNYAPNRGHLFLAELEKWGKDVSIITQNVDFLHTAARSSKVYEVHGTIHKAICPKCKAEYSLDYINKRDIPTCMHLYDDGSTCNTIVKTDVVLFGEMIKHFEEAIEAAAECDLFIVLGSSLEVGPINGLPDYISGDQAIKKVIINLEETKKDHLFDLKIHDRIGDVCINLQQLLTDKKGEFKKAFPE